MATKTAAKKRRRKSSAAGRIYGGLSAAERRADRRERLMSVGLDLFGRAGYHKTTIPMLCSAAGVTARHFYDDFASREELLRAIYDRISDTMQTAVIEAMRLSGATIRESVRASNEAYFRYLTSDPRIARIYVVESRGVSAEMERHRRTKRENIVKRLANAAERLQEHGLDTALESRLLGAAMVGAANDILLEWVLASRRPPVQKMIDTLTTVWMRTLRLDELPEDARATA
jgi:AcrR family transcriptional regulator